MREQEQARRVLQDLIAKYGPELGQDPRRLEGLLRDYAGAYRREIAILVASAREGIPGELLNRQVSLPLELRKARLVQQLQDMAMNADAAHWAVEAWAEALGLPAKPTTSAVPAPPAVTEAVPQQRGNVDAEAADSHVEPSPPPFFTRNWVPMTAAAVVVVAVAVLGATALPIGPHPPPLIPTTVPASAPTAPPNTAPTTAPTTAATQAPTTAATAAPTTAPTTVPTSAPTPAPTTPPITAPTRVADPLTSVAPVIRATYQREGVDPSSLQVKLESVNSSNRSAVAAIQYPDTGSTTISGVIVVSRASHLDRWQLSMDNDGNWKVGQRLDHGYVGGVSDTTAIALMQTVLEYDHLEENARRALDATIISPRATAELVRTLDRQFSDYRSLGVRQISTLERITFCAFKKISDTAINVYANEVWTHHEFNRQNHLNPDNSYTSKPQPQIESLVLQTGRWLLDSYDFEVGPDFPNDCTSGNATL